MSEPGPSSSGPGEEDHTWGEPRVATKFRPSLTDRMCQRFRTVISQKRARFVYQGLDLDLAYITDRIIAMGYPSKGYEAGLRNTMKQTVEFLRRRHGVGRVKVFNLRGGFYYDAAKFDYNVITFDMTDHHPPRLELMAPFCREAKEWLDADPQNVIAVHCKAGKGRTGVMICALLIYINFYTSPRQILDYYSIVRTQNNKGVTIPSQRRYIYYYNALRNNQLNYFPLRQQLVGIYVEKPPATIGNGAKIQIKVANGSTIVFSPPVLNVLGNSWEAEKHAWRGKRGGTGEDDELVSRRAYCFMVPDDEPVFVEGDVRVDLLGVGKKLGPFGNNKIGHVWFNTMFACRGACRCDFEYGDLQFAYADGETSIGKKTLAADEEELEDTSGCADKMELDLKIVKPPGLEAHAPEEAVTEMYIKYGMVPPRHHISHLLHSAHHQKIVTDEFNLRRRRETTSGPLVELAQSLPVRGVDGPMRIPLETGQHVLTFPVYEMDRALKDKKLDDGLKLHVVLKCIDSVCDKETMRRSEVFCNMVFSNEDVRATQAAVEYTGYECQRPPVAAVGAELRFPPTIRYSDEEGTYNGDAHPNLSSASFDGNWRASTMRWCRYFYKQKLSSPSKYPDKTHKCALTGAKFRLASDEPSDDDEDPHPPPTTSPSSSQKPSTDDPTSTEDIPDLPCDSEDVTVTQEWPTFPVRLAEPESFIDDDKNEGFMTEDLMGKYKALAKAQRDMDKYYIRGAAGILHQDYQYDLETIYSTSAVFRRLVITNLQIDHLSEEDQNKFSVISQQETHHDLLSDFVLPESTSTPEGGYTFEEDMDHLAAIMETLYADYERTVFEEVEKEEFERTGAKIEVDLKNWEWCEKALIRHEAENNALGQNAAASSSSTTPALLPETYNSELERVQIARFRNMELKRLKTLHCGTGLFRVAFGRVHKWPEVWSAEEHAVQLSEEDEKLLPTARKPPKVSKSSVETARKVYFVWRRKVEEKKELCTESMHDTYL